MNRTITNMCLCGAVILSVATSAKADIVEYLGNGLSLQLNFSHDGVAFTEFIGEMQIDVNGATTPAVASPPPNPTTKNLQEAATTSRSRTMVNLYP